MNDRTEATLAAVFRAVTHLILEKGVAGVTLSAVCQRAGISKGGLMHHFPTKEAMVSAFVDRSCEQCLQQTHDGLAHLAPGGGRKTKAFVDLMLADPSMCEPESGRGLAAVMIAMMQGSFVGDASVFYDTVYDELRGDGVPKSVVDLVVAAIDGLWLQSMVLPTDVVEKRAEQLRKQLRRVIAASVQTKLVKKVMS